MHWVVVGAGAVGCYFGGMLARAGQRVTLVARPQHVLAIAQHGLRVQTAQWDEHVDLHATTDLAVAAQADVVLCGVKSNDTETTGVLLRPWVMPGTPVLSLQNGVDNAPRLATAMGRAPDGVIPAVVYVATEMAGPGHVRHHGRGELVVSDFTDAHAVVAAFAHAGVPVQVSANVLGALWAKLVVNCAYNALSAITRLPYGPLSLAPGVGATMRQIMGECLAVAQADGVTIPGDNPDASWAAIEGIARTMSGQRSSTAQDLMRGKPTEIAHLNGYVVRRGAAHGIATPTNALLQTLVQVLENQAANPATMSPP